jgi:hypothetical protein
VSTVAPGIAEWRMVSIERMLCRRGRRASASTVLRLTTGHNLGPNHRWTHGPGRSVDARVAFCVKTRHAGRECSDASSCQHVPHWEGCESGDDDSYGFDVQGGLAIDIHVCTTTTVQKAPTREAA